MLWRKNDLHGRISDDRGPRHSYEFADTKLLSVINKTDVRTVALSATNLNVGGCAFYLQKAEGNDRR